MLIEKVKVTDINPATYNPRVDLKPGYPEYEKLKKSISIFGYVDPIIWNKRTSNLVGGHQRFKILLEQGISEVEVSVVDLPLDKEKALNLALNKISGSWDKDRLASLLDELIHIPEVDISLTGFDMPEISSILDDYAGLIELPQGEDPEDIEKPITQPGDLIELGPHRILCGDSSKKEDIDKLFQGKKANLVFTDPPYNVAYHPSNRPISDEAQSKAQNTWRVISNDNLSQEEYELWLIQVLTNMSDYLDKGAAYYIWNGHKQFGPMHQMLNKLGFHVSCVITWAKESFALGYGDYNQQTEFCIHGWKEDNGSHRWYGPKNESTLWQINRESVSTYLHPTQKAVALAVRAIKNSSQREDIVLDMFLGSGTTLIAAEGLKRICYGVELDPRYCDVLIRRYIEFVGKGNVSEEIVKRYFEYRESRQKCLVKI
jgi:DNA modification methylase